MLGGPTLAGKFAARDLCRSPSHGQETGGLLVYLARYVLRPASTCSSFYTQRIAHALPGALAEQSGEDNNEGQRERGQALARVAQYSLRIVFMRGSLWTLPSESLTYKLSVVTEYGIGEFTQRAVPSGCLPDPRRPVVSVNRICLNFQGCGFAAWKDRHGQGQI
jgi:hypothetical protein